MERCSSFKNFFTDCQLWFSFFYLTENLVFRGVESSGKSPLDLCILVLREVNNAHVAVGNLITHSPRQLRCFVGCNVMLEAGEYVVIPLAFNNWNTSKWLPVCYCQHIQLFFLLFSTLLAMTYIYMQEEYMHVLTLIHTHKTYAYRHPHTHARMHTHNFRARYHRGSACSTVELGHYRCVQPSQEVVIRSRRWAAVSRKFPSGNSVKKVSRSESEIYWWFDETCFALIWPSRLIAVNYQEFINFSRFSKFGQSPSAFWRQLGAKQA